MSSGNLDKYEYLIGEDLNYKPHTVEQAKFDYSLLSKFFNKGLKEDKKEGLLKRLKNIEDKSEEQVIKAVKNKAEDEVTYFVQEPLGLEANALTEKVKIIQKDNDYTKFKITDGNNVTYDLYKINKINLMQCSMLWVDTLQETKKIYWGKTFYKGREKIIEEFKNRIFPIYRDDEYSRFKDNDVNDIRDRKGLIDYEKLIRLNNLKRRDINDEFFREYFKYQDSGNML